MGILKDALTAIVNRIPIFKKQKKFKTPLNKEQLSDILNFELDMLNSINMFFQTFDKKNLNTLTTIYMKNKLSLPRDKKYVGDIIPDLKRLLVDKAGQAEREMTFGAARVATARNIAIVNEAIRNIDQFFTDKFITIDNVKISSMMLFGIFKEINIFNKYTCFLIDHFGSVTTGVIQNPIGYRATFLLRFKEIYINILNSIINYSGVYGIMQDINKIKSARLDVILCVDGESNLAFVDENAFTNNQKNKIVHGIAGFRVVASIMEWWYEWKHEKYLDNKANKEWLEAHRAKLLLQLQNADPNSEEAMRLQKIIDSYSQEIADYDQKLQEYEESLDE